jgi:type I restriction enzyme S subunit
MVRFIRIIDITNSAEPERYIENPGNNHLICKNDLFMIRYGTPGLISIGYDGVIANNLFRLIWNNNEFYKSKFWYFVFQRIEKFIYDLSTSSSMPAISFSTLEGISLLYPKNTSEQQKIAETLSSLDDLITAQSQKIEALKMHKKGLLQGLFPDVNEVDLSNLRSLKTDQN